MNVPWTRSETFTLSLNAIMIEIQKNRLVIERNALRLSPDISANFQNGRFKIYFVIDNLLIKVHCVKQYF